MPYPTEIDAIRRQAYGLHGFRRFAKLLGLKIHPYQAFMLAFYFAGVSELVILISKKNGKTTLLAALALYHLLKTSNAECVIGASSRDQATILFNQATRMVVDAGLERKPLPNPSRGPTFYSGVFEVRSGYRIIKFEQGRIRVLAADADTADGVIPTLAIVDELHRHPSGALYGVFRDGLLGDAQMVTISTAGASMESPLGQLLTTAQTFTKEQVGRRRVYSSPDRSFVLVEWALNADDDPHDMKIVEKVNPAPWHTTTTLRRRHDSPSTTPGQWLRFACGLWTVGEEPWMDSRTWDGLAQDIGNVEEGEPVWLALRDGAVAIVAQRGDGVTATAVIGPDEFEAAEDLIEDLAETYDVQEVAYDAQAFGRSADMLAHKGIPMVETPHRVERLTQVSATIQRLIAQGLLHHDGDPELRSHVLAGTTKQSERGWRLMMAPENRGLIALAFAAHSASLGSRHKPTIHVWQAG